MVNRISTALAYQCGSSDQGRDRGVLILRDIVIWSVMHRSSIYRSYLNEKRYSNQRAFVCYLFPMFHESPVRLHIPQAKTTLRRIEAVA